MRQLAFIAAVAVLTFGVSIAVFAPLASDVPASENLTVTQAPGTTGAMQQMGQTVAMEESTSMSGAHTHALRDVADSDTAPTVTHLMFPDAADGYTLQILTDNFTFTPASINQAPVENEGHAHLYINGEKVSRVYGHWLHVPSSLLSPGMNIVSISLNANDHSQWALNGLPIMSSVRVVLPETPAPLDG